MAYARPTLAQFKALFPAFLTLTQEQYEAWIGKAEARVTDLYGDDQQDATELLAAHLLALNGVGAAPGVDTIAASGVTSFKSASFSANLSESVVTQRSKGGYQATSYGQQFADIQRRLFSGPLLVGNTCLPEDCC